MTKKLIPAMVGVALAGGMTAAAADVTVFGHLDTSLDHIDLDDGAGSSEDDVNLHCTTCSIGFKGSEDLGNGLKAIFKLDFQFNMTERNRDRQGASGSQDDTAHAFAGSDAPYREVTEDAITDRDQWLGLAGNFGQVRIGTISTGYKSHGAMLDPLYRTSLQGRQHFLQSEFHSGAGEEAQGRATNTIRYDSPSFNGFKAVAHYTIDNNKIDDGEDDNPFGIGASYENGGILAFADYITNDGDATATSDTNAWKIGGKFSMNQFAVMAQYEDFEYDSGAGEEGTNWHIGGSYSMGNNLLYAAYGQRDDEDNGGDTSDIDSWTIAGMHSLSKRTKVYLGYNTAEDDISDAEADQISLGMKHKF
jgi:predicted porin